jgi:hypothetical protein
LPSEAQRSKQVADLGDARAWAGTGSRQMMSYDALLQCLVNERLPSDLRFLYSRLMLTLYLEVTPIDRVLAVRTVLGVGEIGKDDFQLAGAELRAQAGDSHDTQHNMLRKEVLLCLGNKSTFRLPDREGCDAHLTLALLELTQEMTACGYYSEERMLHYELIPALVNVIDFSLDVVVLPVDLRHGRTECALDRHVLCPDTLPMMRSKLVACDILHQVCDFRLTLRLQRMLTVFREMMLVKADGPCRRTSSYLQKAFAHISFAEASSQTDFEDLPDRSTTRRNRSPSCIKVITDLASDLKGTNVLTRIKDIMSCMPLVNEMDHGRFVRLLLDNMRCQMHELARSSLTLLMRDRAPNMEIYLRLVDIQILTDARAEQEFGEIEAKVNLLRKLAHPFQLTVSSTRDPHRLTARQRDQLLLVLADLTDMCSPELQDPLAREAAGRSWLSKDYMRRLNAHNIVIEMLSWCMSPHGDPDGVFVGAEVSMPELASSPSPEHKTLYDTKRMELTSMRWLVRECLPAIFVFLEHFSRGLPRNQTAMSHHVHLISNFLRWGVSGVPQTLSGIYESNKPLCDSLDTRVIDTVVDYLAYGPSGTASKSAVRKGSADTSALSSQAINPFGSSAAATGGNEGPSNKGRLSDKPVFDVLCLRFLETTFNVSGEMVRTNQRYVLRSLITHGPASINDAVAESVRRHLSTEQRASARGEDGGSRELALQLFRGKEGARVRDQARQARAGIQDPLNDVLEYNIALLRLLRFLALDVGPDDKELLRSLVDPARMARDVCGTASLARAKASTLDLFCTLFLSPGLRKKSSSQQTQDALWMLLDYLNDQLKLADERALALSFERSHGGDTLAVPADFALKGEQAAKKANEELELLLADHWAPLLDAVLNDTFLLEVMSDSNRKTLESIFNCLLQLLQSVLNCAPLGGLESPRDPAEERKVQESFVTIRALWQKLANMQHPPITVPDAQASINMEQIEFELHERYLRKRPKMPKYKFLRPEEPKNSLVANRQLRCFAQALLNVVDPMADEDDYNPDDPLRSAHEKANGEADEEDDDESELDSDDDEGHEDFPEPEIRGELLGLCKLFYDEFSDAQFNDLQLGREIMTPIDSLVDIVRASRYGDKAESKAELECQTMLLLRVLRGLVVFSGTESCLPTWILTRIPELIVEIIGTKGTSDRIVQMALELGIRVLQVSPPTPVQQSFYEVLVSSDRRSADFLGELLMRMRRGEEEILLTRQFWDGIHNTGSIADPADLLAMVKAYGSRLSGRFQCLHLQMVEAHRGEEHPTSHVEAIFRFLQLLCEGHNLCLQNYLRSQTSSNSIRSVDLVSATASFVISSTPHICPLIISTPLRALQALAEYVQNPCRANQRVIVDTALVASANSLLNLNDEDSAASMHVPLGHRLLASSADWVALTEEATIQFVEDCLATECASYQEGVHALKAATITCLLSLLECVDDPYIPERMLATLGDDPLRLNMNALVLHYNPDLVKRLRSNGEIDEPKHRVKSELTAVQRDAARKVAQQFYITYITLAGFDSTGRFAQGMTRDKIWDIDSLLKTVGAIEISRGGVVEKAYFVIPSLCQYLTRASKQQILMGVNRANLQTMLKGFVEAFDALFEEMKHQQQLTERTVGGVRVLNLFRVTLEWREKVFFYNAILINVLLLLFYNYECNQTFICGDNETLDHYRIKPGWRELVVLLACVQCLFAITRQWWYVVERGIPMIQARIEANHKDPPTHWLWAMIVWLPTELADPIYRHISRRHNRSVLGLSVWRLHFVQVWGLGAGV